MIELEDIIQSYKINEKGERDAINRFNFETEDSGEILVRLNCMSHNYDRKKKNREKFEIEKEKQDQEIVKIINAERIKQIKKYRKKIKDEIDEEELVSDQDSRYRDSYTNQSYTSYNRDGRDSRYGEDSRYDKDSRYDDRDDRDDRGYQDRYQKQNSFDRDSRNDEPRLDRY